MLLQFQSIWFLLSDKKLYSSMEVGLKINLTNKKHPLLRDVFTIQYVD